MSNFTCAICGKFFIVEWITNGTVKPFRVDGCEQQLYAHNECFEQFGDKDIDWRTLPEGPLKKAFQELYPEVQSSPAPTLQATSTGAVQYSQGAGDSQSQEDKR